MLSSLGILVLRVAIGGMMLAGHGWTKLAGFTDKLATFPDPLGVGPGLSLSLAIFAEVLCAICLILGFLTRIVAAPLLVTMLVAAFVVHEADPWSQKELALLYAVPFLTLMLTGGGDYSADALLGRRRRRRPRL